MSWGDLDDDDMDVPPMRLSIASSTKSEVPLAPSKAPAWSVPGRLASVQTSSIAEDSQDGFNLAFSKVGGVCNSNCNCRRAIGAGREGEAGGH
jgi:hypothetical protein